MSGSYGRASGSVSVDINTLNQRVNENTNFRTNTQEFTIGSQNVPLPIHIKIVPISIALSDKLWSSPSLRVIRLKKANMIKALNDYAANRQARIDAGIYDLFNLIFYLQAVWNLSLNYALILIS